MCLDGKGEKRSWPLAYAAANLNKQYCLSQTTQCCYDSALAKGQAGAVPQRGIALSPTYSLTELYFLDDVLATCKEKKQQNFSVVITSTSFGLNGHAQGYQSSGHTARSNPATLQTFLSLPSTPPRIKCSFWTKVSLQAERGMLHGVTPSLMIKHHWESTIVQRCT